MVRYGLHRLPDRIGETVGAWEKDDSGSWFLDIIVTENIRVHVGCDGFVFGSETYGRVHDAAYPHEAVSDNTLLL